jgi:putative transposase
MEISMKKKRYSEEQIIGILKENEAGLSVDELARKHDVAAGTIYRWRNQYGGMEVNELKKLKGLEEENRRLKRLVADQALDIQMLKDINSKNW